jgi:hypothetical protein
MAKQQVWELRSLHLDYELLGSTPGVITLQTALPGGTLATASIPAPGSGVPVSARTQQSWQLGLQNAAIYQVTIDPGAGSVLKLFGGHIEARPIGEFYDGTRSERYTSTVLTPGMGG